MQGNNGFGIGKAILLGIGAGILLPLAFYIAFQIGTSKEREYVEKGVLTPCYVQTILSIGGKQQVWVVYQNEKGEDEIRVGRMLPMCLVFDHRAVDFDEIVPFLNRMEEIFKNPEEMYNW